MVSNYNDKQFNVKLNYKKGFTLIELIVVVGIIALLAAIITIGVKESKDKANDVAIKQTLDQVRTLAYIYKNDHGNYGATSFATDCSLSSGELFTGSDMQKAMEEFKKYSPGTTPLCISSDSTGANSVANTWAVSASLKTDKQKSWCVDSHGRFMLGFASLDSNNVSLCY